MTTNYYKHQPRPGKRQDVTRNLRRHRSRHNGRHLRWRKRRIPLILFAIDTDASGDDQTISDHESEGQNPIFGGADGKELDENVEESAERCQQKHGPGGLQFEKFRSRRRPFRFSVQRSPRRFRPTPLHLRLQESDFVLQTQRQIKEEYYLRRRCSQHNGRHLRWRKPRGFSCSRLN